MVLVPEKYQIDISLQRRLSAVGACRQRLVGVAAKQRIDQLVEGDGDLLQAHGVIPWLAAKNIALTTSAMTTPPMVHMTFCWPFE